jgi:hypothetical protein
VSQPPVAPADLLNDNPLIIIDKYDKIKIFTNTEPVVLNWNLPGMSKRFGTVAMQYSQTWKKIHTRSEKVYAAFRIAHIEILLSHELKNLHGVGSAARQLDTAVEEFQKFCNDIQSYPDEVAQAEHLVEFQKAREGFSALNWLIVNSDPGTKKFMDAVIYIERLCAWSFETLIRADQMLEKYFEIK